MPLFSQFSFLILETILAAAGMGEAVLDLLLMDLSQPCTSPLLVESTNTMCLSSFCVDSLFFPLHLPVSRFFLQNPSGKNWTHELLVRNSPVLYATAEPVSYTYQTLVNTQLNSQSVRLQRRLMVRVLIWFFLDSSQPCNTGGLSRLSSFKSWD